MILIFQINRNIDLVDSISGIGSLTAITLIAEIGDIDSFIKPKRLSVFFGLACSVDESVKFKRKKGYNCYNA